MKRRKRRREGGKGGEPVGFNKNLRNFNSNANVLEELVAATIGALWESSRRQAGVRRCLQPLEEEHDQEVGRGGGTRPEGRGWLLR